MNDDFPAGLVVGALCGVLGGILGGVLGPLLVVWLMPRKHCPECEAPLPKLRNNWSPLSVLWVCPECGCPVDRHGKAVDDEPSHG
jgi:hypothetical protein